MQGTPALYSFRVNNTWHTIRLAIFCVLEFLVLIGLFLWWVVAFWNMADDSSLIFGILFCLPFILPVCTYFLFRKKTTEEVTVLLSDSDLQIQWPKKKMIIVFADVKSYSAGNIKNDAYDQESITMRLKTGKKVRLTATSDVCDIKPLHEFRVAFDSLAQNLKLPEKQTWEERLLMSK